MAAPKSSGRMAGEPTRFRPLEPVDGDILYDVVDNEIRELPPMWARERSCASTLFQILSSFAWSRDLGHVHNLMLFLLNPAKNLKRRPDLSLVSFERWPRGRRIPDTSSWAVVPNLVIEVLSPSNTAYEVIEKIRDYFDAGAERVWVIYPDFGVIYDYDSPTTVQILTRNQTIDGGTVLPGFQLLLTELFEDVSDPDTGAGARNRGRSTRPLFGNRLIPTGEVVADPVPFSQYISS